MPILGGELGEQREGGQFNHPNRSRKSNRGHRANEYGGAWEMFSVPPVDVSASFQLPYKELPENANRIPAPQISSECKYLLR